MSKQNLTLATLSADTDERLTAIENGLLALLKQSQPKATAKPAKKASAKPAKKASSKAKASKAPSTVTTLTKRTRAEFVAAHEWAQGMSVARISDLLLRGEQEAPGWKVATFREAKAAGVTTSEFVAQRKGVTVTAKVSGKKKARKAREQDLSLLTYAQLYAQAQTAEVPGRAKMNSAALIKALSA